MQKRAVIILGAGAAHAWGAKLTSQITDVLIRSDWFKSKQGEPIAKCIYDKLCSFYGSDYGVNFETIMSALESFQDYFLNKTAKGQPTFSSSSPFWFDINAHFNDIKNFTIVSTSADGTQYTLKLSNGNLINNVSIGNEESKYLKEVINYFMSLIRNEIACYDNKSLLGEQKELNENLKEFIEYLISKDYLPRFYTTNYDLLIPNILKDKLKSQIFDGFDIPFAESEFTQKYSPNIPRILNDYDCVSYYNLHGSIYWEYVFSYANTFSEFICSPDFPQTTNFYNFGEYTNPGEMTILYNIVTGYNKLQRASIEPFNSFHSVFNFDCINAALIITAGYSFSDFHINRPITNAIRINKVKLLHISYGGTGYSSEMEFSRIKSNILKTQDDFGSNPEVTEKWIYSKSRQQNVFYKGFKDFLENKEWLNSNI